MPVCRSGIARTLRPAGLRLEIHNNAEVSPGRIIDTVFSTNELGMRGPAAAAAEGAYRVLAVGASTTESYLIDDSLAWPHLLGTHLEKNLGRPAWVQNSGVSGHTAVDHLFMLQSNPVTGQAESDPRCVAGVNDLIAALAFEGGSAEAVLVAPGREAFSLFPLYSRSAVSDCCGLATSAPSDLRYDATHFYRKMPRPPPRRGELAAVGPDDWRPRGAGKNSARHRRMQAARQALRALDPAHHLAARHDRRGAGLAMARLDRASG